MLILHVAFFCFFHSLWINDDEESEFRESLRQSPPLNQTLWSPQVGGPGWRRFIFSWSCINSDLRDSPRASVHTRERWSCLGKKTCAQIRRLYLSDCETLWGNRPHAHGAGIPGGARDVTAQRWRSECFMFEQFRSRGFIHLLFLEKLHLHLQQVIQAALRERTWDLKPLQFLHVLQVQNIYIWKGL